MEVYPYAWAYFVPYVLLSSFVVMNVVVGIVVNSISEVTAENAAEEASDVAASTSGSVPAGEEGVFETSGGAADVADPASKTALLAEMRALREQLDRMEKTLAAK